VRATASAFLLACVAAGCASRTIDEDGLPARRADVTAALYRQLDLVIDWRVELAANRDEDTARERERLSRLADEIALRIVRIDPDVDLQRLQEKLESGR